MVAANTLFPHKKSRCTTWHSPNGEVHNQIDYILTTQRFKSSIIRTSTRSYLGADFNSDHDLVLINMKLKLKVNSKPKTTRIRFDVNKLTNGKTADNYKDELEKQLKKLDIHKFDLTASYKKIEDIISDSARRTIGKYRRKKQPWITNDILDLCDERRSLKRAKNKNNIQLISKYRKVNNKIRNDMKTAKGQWIQMQCKSINEDMTYGRHNKRAYDTLKSLTKTPARSTSIIEDKNGQPLADEHSILKRWTEYYQELYNFPIKPDHSVIISQNTDNVDELLMLKLEVEDAIQKLEEGNSPGYT